MQADFFGRNDKEEWKKFAFIKIVGIMQRIYLSYEPYAQKYKYFKCNMNSTAHGQ